MSCHKPTSTECICDVCAFINNLQQQVDPIQEPGCTSEYFGPVNFIPRPNTRPFILYLPDGEVFKARYGNCVQPGESEYFRVERIDGCCAKLRVLRIQTPLHEEERPALQLEPFCPWLVATNSFITVDLSKFIAIQCFGNVYIDLR